MIHEKVLTRSTIMSTDEAKTEAIRTDKGYYLALTTNGTFGFKRVTKKTHDLLIKAVGESDEIIA